MKTLLTIVMSLFLCLCCSDPVAARDPTSEETDWRRFGFYTLTMVRELEQAIIADKKNLSPHTLGDFSQKLNLVLNREGKLLEAKLISSNMPAEQDKHLLDYLSRHKFPAFPNWYKGNDAVTFPLDIRQGQKMTKTSNGEEFPIIGMGIFFNENVEGKSEATKAAKSSKGKTVIMGGSCDTAAAISENNNVEKRDKDLKDRSEKLRADITAMCKRRGVRGKATIKALTNQEGFRRDFEIIEAKRSTKQVINLVNLSYKYMELPNGHEKLEERRLEINIDQKD